MGKGNGVDTRDGRSGMAGKVEEGEGDVDANSMANDFPLGEGGVTVSVVVICKAQEEKGAFLGSVSNNSGPNVSDDGTGMHEGEGGEVGVAEGARDRIAKASASGPSVEESLEVGSEDSGGKGLADNVPVFVEAFKEARDGRNVGGGGIPMGESAGKGSVNGFGVADGFFAGRAEEGGAAALGEGEK